MVLSGGIRQMECSVQFCQVVSGKWSVVCSSVRWYQANGV